MQNPSASASTNARVVPVFTEFVDRALRLRRGDRARVFEAVRENFARFPEIAVADRPGLLRAFALNDISNRLIARLAWCFPCVAVALARFVPIVGPRHFARDVPRDRPIIFALMHFGPIYFAICVAMRLLRNRPVYILHAGGEHGRTVANYFSRIGCIPFVTDAGALREVEDAVARDGRCIVIFCFDHLRGRRRRFVPFLGARLAAPTGLAYLAEKTDALVVPAWWDHSVLGPRLRIEDPCEIDASLAPADRRNDLTDRIFALLETNVRAKPRQWTEWPRC